MDDNLTDSKTVAFTIGSLPVYQEICGVHDKNLTLFEENFKVRIIPRGNTLIFRGSLKNVNKCDSFINGLEKYIESRLVSEQKTGPFHLDEYQLSNLINEAGKKDITTGNSTGKGPLSATKQYADDQGVDFNYSNNEVKEKIQVEPKSKNQARLIESLSNNTITIAVGPAGTGKTFLSVAYALYSLNNGLFKRIILTRPAVEAGESLGFLPGDLIQKVNPYLRPLYDSLYELAGPDQVRKWMDEGVIEIAPLAFMRGRTLANAFIILDEAQNTTKSQMKMFLTRLGYKAKMAISGDITQIDLDKKYGSGLIQALKIFSHIREIGIIKMEKKDISRHPLVGKIVHAYEKREQDEANLK